MLTNGDIGNAECGTAGLVSGVSLGNSISLCLNHKPCNNQIPLVMKVEVDDGGVKG